MPSRSEEYNSFLAVAFDVQHEWNELKRTDTVGGDVGGMMESEARQVLLKLIKKFVSAVKSQGFTVRQLNTCQDFIIGDCDTAKYRNVSFEDFSLEVAFRIHQNTVIGGGKLRPGEGFGHMGRVIL